MLQQIEARYKSYFDDICLQRLARAGAVIDLLLETYGMVDQGMGCIIWHFGKLKLISLTT